MTDQLRAQQGDTLDLLLWRERGFGSADLAPVLAANPGLAARGPVLPTGTLVRLPDSTPAPTVRNTVNLWD